ncbi:GAF and ANTAR domain-containing protein [Arthrobacter sp. N1]|uniref:GAF and ANTAR domain-containing protein n=1 Tax=Arthrobacter sp. N1 TaxID=619291 RepID=UPI003BAF23C8
MTTPSSDELKTIFGRTKGYLLTEQTAHDAVDGLAEVARDVVGPATGAGVSVISVDGQRQSIGATDARVLEADTLQYELGEGPCLTAWASGEPAHIPDTEEDQRWPQWSAAVADRGVRSCLSVPLLHADSGRVGALKVYANTPRAFTDGHEQVLMNLSRSAAALLSHIQASDLPQRISAEMKIALDARDTVALARGIIMERLDLTRDEAMNHLVKMAVEAESPLVVMASRIAERQNGSDLTTRR